MNVAALSDVGMRRTNNEDAWTIADLTTGQEISSGTDTHEIHLDERPMLLAVSDGMGGHAAGEVASALVLESLRAAMTGDAAGDDAAEPMYARIDAAVKRADRAVKETAQAQSKQGMGATLTAVFVDGTKAYVAEVGDSRAYLLRGAQLKQVTRDQSFVQMLVDTGVMTPDEARTSPNRNMILQSMGQKGDVRVAICRLQLRRLDKLLICSDGITGEVQDYELAEILSTHTPAAACARMIELANSRGGADNQTAVVAHFEGEDFELPLTEETVTSTMLAIQDYLPAHAFAHGEPEQSAEAAPAPAAAAPAPAAESPAPQPVAQTASDLGAPAAATATPPPAATKLKPWIIGVAVVVLVVGYWFLSCCSK